MLWPLSYTPKACASKDLASLWRRTKGEIATRLPPDAARSLHTNLAHAENNAVIALLIAAALLSSFAAKRCE